MNQKLESMDNHRENADDQFLTTSMGVRVEDDQNSLKEQFVAALAEGRQWSRGLKPPIPTPARNLPRPVGRVQGET